MKKSWLERLRNVPDNQAMLDGAHILANKLLHDKDVDELSRYRIRAALAEMVAEQVEMNKLRSHAV